MIRQLSVDEVERLRPAIDKAVQQKMAIVDANNPTGYREKMQEAIERLENSGQS